MGKKKWIVDSDRREEGGGLVAIFGVSIYIKRSKVRNFAIIFIFSEKSIDTYIIDFISFMFSLCSLCVWRK